MWRLGDAWRDLAPEVEAADGPVTVVSASGTARILSATGWQVRVPLEGGHVMARDLVRHPLARLVCATPCGVHTTDYIGGWHQTTPLVLVLAGEHPRWLLTDVGRRVFPAVRSKRRPAPGHPEQPCGAAYCQLRTASASGGACS